MLVDFKKKLVEGGVFVLILLLFMGFGSVVYPSPAECGNAIHLAAYHGKTEKVREYLDQGVDVDERDSFGGTALHAALFQNDTRIVKMLIEAGYDVNARDSSNGFTPLHDAVWANNLAGAQLLVESGARLDIRDNKGLTPYEKAKAEGRTRLLEVLKEK